MCARRDRNSRQRPRSRGRGLAMIEDRAELEALRRAYDLLEHPGLAARISDLVGTPIERGFQLLPERWGQVVNEASRKAIESSLSVALGTMDAGYAGAAFGLMALSVELPLSTTIMLRSIADIARAQGEKLDQPEARLQCLQVLALGGRSKADDAAEAGYFAARVALARTISEAASHIAQKGLSQKSAPAVVRLVSQVAARISIVVSEKAAAQAVPLVGAFGGAAINAIFIDH